EHLPARGSGSPPEASLSLRQAQLLGVTYTQSSGGMSGAAQSERERNVGPWTREAPHFITFASTAFISGVAKEKGQYTARWLWRAAEAAVRDLRAHELTKLTAACGAYNLAESCSAGLGCAGGACASADAAAGAAGLVLADAALVAVPAAAAGAAGAALAMAAWGRRGAGPQQVWPAA
ncbi:unnamed protein product, partial [Prorocentrum cordatum]